MSNLWWSHLVEKTCSVTKKLNNAKSEVHGKVYNMSGRQSKLRYIHSAKRQYECDRKNKSYHISCLLAIPVLAVR